MVSINKLDSISFRENKIKLSFEALEDRKMLSAVGFVYGPPTYETWLQQEAGAVYSAEAVPAPVDVGSLLEESSSEFDGSGLDNSALSDGVVEFQIMLNDLSDDAGASDVDFMNELDLDSDSFSFLQDSGSGNRSGGGSGGSGNPMWATISGGSTVVPEGRSVILVFTGGHVGDVITASLSGLSANDYYASTLSVQTNGSVASLNINILEDSYIEGDETLSISLSLTTSEGTTLSPTSFNITVVDQPEFISDGDDRAAFNSTGYAPDAGDSYSAYIKKDFLAGASIVTKTPIFAAGSHIEYSMTSDIENFENYFSIDSSTGVITLAENAATIIAGAELADSFSITVYANDTRLAEMSGGSDFEDSATISVTISSWSVERWNTNSRARAAAKDGCTVAELADLVGLDSSEFHSWLSANQNAEIELFDGSVKTLDELTATDVLASSRVLFVPNTIYAAYCYNPSLYGTFGWSDNLEGFRHLGFNVETFHNSDYTDSYTAEATFLNGIGDLSLNSELQGIYLIGHGTTTGFGFDEPDNNNPLMWGDSWGPMWTVNYAGTQNVPGFQSSWSIEAELEYHLGAACIYACHSESAFQYLLASTYSLRYGFSGVVCPHYWYFPTLWGVEDNGNYRVFGGLQGTNTYVDTPDL